MINEVICAGGHCCAPIAVAVATTHVHKAAKTTERFTSTPVTVLKETVRTLHGEEHVDQNTARRRYNSRRAAAGFAQKFQQVRERLDLQQERVMPWGSSVRGSFTSAGRDRASAVPCFGVGNSQSVV